jgi:hypothetical protein
MARTRVPVYALVKEGLSLRNQLSLYTVERHTELATRRTQDYASLIESHVPEWILQ